MLSGFYLYIVFSSPILLPFASREDLSVFQSIDHSVCTDNPQFESLRKNGQTLAAGLTCLLSQRVYQTIDFSFARLLTTLFLALGMAGFAATLHSLKLSRGVALALAGCVFTLPGFLTYDLAAMSAPLTLSYILALSAYALANKISPEDLRTKWLSLKVIFLTGATLILLVAAADISLAGLAFFLVPTAAGLLFKNFDEWPDTRLQLLHNGILWTTAYAAHLLGHRMGVSLRLPDGKLAIKILNLWDIYAGSRLAATVLLVVSLGALAAAYGYILKSSGFAERRQRLWQAAQSAAVLAVVVFLTSEVALNEGELASFRMLTACQAVWALLLFWALSRIAGLFSTESREKLLLGCAALIFLAGGILGQRHIFDTTINQEIMRDFVRSNLKPHLGDLHAVHFIRLKDTGRTYTNFPILPVVDEFNRHHEEYGYAELVYSFLIDHRDKLKSRETMSTILVDYNKQKESLAGFPGTVVTVSKPGEPVLASEGAIVINMNHLMFPQTMPAIPRQTLYVTPPIKCEPQSNSRIRVWRGYFEFEVKPLPPPNIVRECRRPTVAKGYFLAAGPQIHSYNAVERMPIGWKVQGSNDQINWVDLDIQQDQINWLYEEKRFFGFAQPGEYKYYQLMITAGPPTIRLYAFEVLDLDEKAFIAESVDRESLLSPDATAFWAPKGPYPYLVELVFDPPFKAEKYSLVSAFDAEKSSLMPTLWALQGSNDNNTWINLDVVGKQAPWSPLEQRIYSIAYPGRYRHYRFIFSAGDNPETIVIGKLRLLP